VLRNWAYFNEAREVRDFGFWGVRKYPKNRAHVMRPSPPLVHDFLYQWCVLGVSVAGFSAIYNHTKHNVAYQMDAMRMHNFVRLLELKFDLS
jgi:hypothetical protein